MQKPIFCHLFEGLNQIQVLGAHLDMRCLTSVEKQKQKNSTCNTQVHTVPHGNQIESLRGRNWGLELSAAPSIQRAQLLDKTLVGCMCDLKGYVTFCTPLFQFSF